MDTKEIQARLDAMPAKMSAKGKATPSATFSLEGNSQPKVYIRWNPKPSDPFAPNIYEWFKGETIGQQLDAADAFIEAMPSRDEELKTQFMRGLADLVELGKSSGIEVAFVNPLTELMKTLSENAITFQPPEPKRLTLAESDIPF